MDVLKREGRRFSLERPREGGAHPPKPALLLPVGLFPPSQGGLAG